MTRLSVGGTSTSSCSCSDCEAAIFTKCTQSFCFISCFFFLDCYPFIFFLGLPFLFVHITCYQSSCTHTDPHRHTHNTHPWYTTCHQHSDPKARTFTETTSIIESLYGPDSPISEPSSERQQITCGNNRSVCSRRRGGHHAKATITMKDSHLHQASIKQVKVKLSEKRTERTRLQRNDQLDRSRGTGP